ncbi:hypothetical protein [Desulforhopalus singaporensis]|uniref:Uncharacterized protein n=1 Tax=Desulforhopalus singaporensis TaxID=91360 RepID=A0A1H0QVV0_9BACT|nr:hypothetical protein [Desulforhopalus singaporensis]SDP21403.1 hypothetical protein SAMN05660330_02096 [Desulforhopalus singaporensis]
MPVLIDGHVHVHSSFSLNLFLESAWKNFSSGAERLKLSGDCVYVLALAEGQRADVFGQMKKIASADSGGSDYSSEAGREFAFFRTREEQSLVARRGEQVLVIVAGRQILSREGLEVLSLASLFRVDDHLLPLAELTQTVIDRGGVAVVPWGVGKWWGKRGRIVAETLSLDRPLLYGGDNGNRPAFWPRPRIFPRPQQPGKNILSGSDPLPLTGHQARGGCFGSAITDGSLSLDCPAKDLRTLLGREKNRLIGYGRGASVGRFISDQFRVNLKKRLSR